MTELFKHQLELIFRSPERCLIAHGTGTGKSRTAIELALKNVSSCLVICPKALKENWKREIEKWKGNRSTRFIVISKEEFRKMWNELDKFSGVICDESHYFFGMKSQMMKSLASYFKKHDIKYRWLLTATPYLSTAWNIFVAGRLLGYPFNYATFKYKFFQDVRFGSRIIPVQRKGIEKEIALLVKKIGDTVSMEECVDVPDQIFETEILKLNQKQIKEIESIKDILPIVRFTKQHQIENGILIGDEYNPSKTFDTAKNERIIELIKEFKRVAIFCRYNLQIKTIKSVIENEFGDKKSIFVINGEVKNRDEIVQKINRSENYIVLINSACSEGYEIPSIDLVIYASLGFSFKDHLQSQGRFLRINNLRKNLYMYLISGEVDKAVFDSLNRKEDFNIEIYAKKT